MSGIYIDGDFRSHKGDCRFHCSPTVHPAQIGPEWIYGCTHPAWPQNQQHDFVPIVNCGGLKAKCELSKKDVGNYRGGLTRRINSLTVKLENTVSDRNELDEFVGSNE